ncbi:hypothetical protein AB0I53_19160 [Saccharopolyspora sp. NPDC050389]|uniref:hypothetical protein n=1 Tax=Saccharopolyspora sp. NPDC050389 TaxID=3155516 RepID=UPI0033ECA45D
MMDEHPGSRGTRRSGEVLGDGTAASVGAADGDPQHLPAPNPKLITTKGDGEGVL